VIVYELNIVSVSLVPAEADTPLVIDPNAVLSLSISSQFLKAISRRDNKVVQSLRRIQQEQLPLSAAPQITREFPRRLAVKYLFSFFGRKSPDHDHR
jgi:hypothetical protein